MERDGKERKGNGRKGFGRVREKGAEALLKEVDEPVHGGGRCDRDDGGMCRIL